MLFVDQSLSVFSRSRSTANSANTISASDVFEILLDVHNFIRLIIAKKKRYCVDIKGYFSEWKSIHNLIQRSIQKEAVKGATTLHNGT